MVSSSQEQPQDYVHDPMKVDPNFYRAFRRGKWALRATMIAVICPLLGFLGPMLVMLFVGLYVWATYDKQGSQAHDKTVLIFVYLLGGVVMGLVGFIIASLPAFIFSAIGLTLGIRSRSLAKDASPKRAITSIVLSAVVGGISLGLLLITLVLVIVSYV